MKKFALMMTISLMVGGVGVAQVNAASNAESEKTSYSSATYKYFAKRGMADRVNVLNQPQVNKATVTTQSKTTKVENKNTTKTTNKNTTNKVTNPTKTTTKINTTTSNTTNTSASPSSQAYEAFELQVVELTNVERKKAGLAPLQVDNLLMNNAEQKSLDMKQNKYFSHTSPTLGSPFEQMKNNGITYKKAGENIAKGQSTPEQVVQAWMDSPGHRENIMNSNYTHIGIGYVNGGHYWTQQFIQK